LDRPAYISPIIIYAQFAGTSLWFADNAIISDLQQSWTLPEHSTSYVTSAVQLALLLEL
jgi:hypothetical protein